MRMTLWNQPGLGLARALCALVPVLPAVAAAQPPPAAEAPPSAPSVESAQAPRAEPTEDAPVSGPAGAPASSAASARIEGIMTFHREQGERYRVWGAVTGALVAGAAIPAGIVLLDRGQTTPGAIAVGVGAGAAAGALATLLFPVGTMGSVVAAYEEARQGGAPPAAVVEATERAWKKQADEARLGRQIGAPVLGILGAAALGTGVFFAATQDRIGNLSAGDQAGLGAALVAGGALGLIGAVQLACFTTPVESSWEEYKRNTGRGVGYSPREPRLVPQLAVVPTQGGAYASAGLVF